MRKIERRALTDLVYEKIKLMIQDGVLVPAQKVSKKQLALYLGVSQTPVNEAVNRLKGEGLIEQRNRQGFFIKTFTYEDMKDLFAVRAGLEGVAVRLCIEELPDERLEELVHLFDGFDEPLGKKELGRYLKADRQFHERLIALSRNSLIISMNNNFDFMLKSHQKGLIRSPQETLPEHRAIIRAIRDRDAQRAQELCMLHQLKSRDVIKEKHLKFTP